MINFKDFLFVSKLDESLADHTKHITHLSHYEDMGHEYGHEGTEHAIAALKDAHDHIANGKHDDKLTTKIDGGVSVVAGHHPNTGQPFVAYKGELGKMSNGTDTKVCYSHADCDKHFGDKPYLVDKMKSLLDHTHKVLPKKGVYQGDVLFGEHDKKDEGNKVSFTPNTITYSAKKSTNEGKKIGKAKLGISFHTAYDKQSDGSLQARPVKQGEIGSHDGVYHLSTSNDTSKANLPESEKTEFHNHIAAAEAIHNHGGHAMYDAIKPTSDHISTYINQTVRDGTSPSTEGLKAHISEKHQKLADKVKTEKSKQSKIKTGEELNNHIDNNQEHFDNYFKMHHHIQEAKNTLVHALNNADHPLEHTIDGKSTHPEGYVSYHEGVPGKLVDRQEFAKANFAKART